MNSPTVDTLVDAIRVRIDSCGLSPRQLSDLADLGSDNTIRGYRRPDWSPSVRTLRRIEAALDRLPPESVDLSEDPLLAGHAELPRADPAVAA